MFAVCYDLFPEFLEKVEEVKKSDEMCVTVLASSCQFLPVLAVRASYYLKLRI